MMLNFVLTYAWASNPARLAIAGAVTLGFAVLARGLRGVNRSGMLAGGCACFLLFAGAGPAAFAALTALFVLTWAATRLGFRRKQELGVAERGDGRNAGQVLANLGVAALASVFFSTTGNRAWLVAASAALAEAATDTVASEIGQTHRTARMITTGETVPAGTDGGVTPLGTVAGTFAGLLVAGVSAGAGMIPPSRLWIPFAAGFAGMIVDSLLGATVQHRRWLNNEAVNLLGTLAAAAVAYGISGW
jgi:uncharacterized protein (TIGR00297 family)